MEYVSGSTIYKNMTILKFLLQLCWNAHLLSTHLKFIIFTQKRFLSQCAGTFISTLRPVSTLLPFCLNGSHVLLSKAYEALFVPVEQETKYAQRQCSIFHAQLWYSRYKLTRIRVAV